MVRRCGSESNLVEGLLVVRSATARVLAFSLLDVEEQQVSTKKTTLLQRRILYFLLGLLLLKTKKEAREFSGGNKVLREVTGETTAAWVLSKLETLYMTKSLANKLYLKKKLLELGKTPSRSFRPVKSAEILWQFWASSSFGVSLAHDGSWSKWEPSLWLCG
ncbi:hypothetical protein Tco_0834803 [Tanacetum coccineum]